MRVRWVQFISLFLTALASAFYGAHRSVSRLLEAGASVLARNVRHMTPLHLAFAGGSLLKTLYATTWSISLDTSLSYV